jgi:hypothetical protein
MFMCLDVGDAGWSGGWPWWRDPTDSPLLCCVAASLLSEGRRRREEAVYTVH